MKTWRLKKGADRRVRQGHPWVFTSELSHSAKEISPGELIELRSDQEHFLAYGYGHPSSQISFRKLTSRSKEKDVFSEEFFVRRLKAARAHRAAAGWTRFSHRWFYAESDGVPGLIIDAFLNAEDGAWTVVVQASTAGVEKVLPEVYQALASFKPELGEMTIVEAPSSRSRVLEGLKVGEKKVISGPAARLEGLEIALVDGLRLRADILQGQKTGFFLDQQWNASLLRQILKHSFAAPRPEMVRVLDICCYVGQWAAHSTQALRELGQQVEVTLVDVSEEALSLAKRNAESAGAAGVVELKGDALEALGELPQDAYDVVICDPPAFVKKKADLEPGMRAYTKLIRDSLRLVRPGGIFVASSCSGLVRTEDWQRVLREASTKAGRSFKQLAVGGHGPDHPLRPEFPEGEYLKCVIGRVDYPF